MADPMPRNEDLELVFEAYGVRVRVASDRPEALDRVPALLPPNWRPCSPSALDTTFTIRAVPDDKYELAQDGRVLVDAWQLDVALVVLERELRAFVALEAPEHVFVHAGVVAHGGRAIVIPGETFAGKTTLVAALIRAGAVYYSDEYAVLDESGRVHPYPKPLSLRERFTQSDHHVEALGGVAGHEPVPAGMVLLTTYRPGAEWKPRRLSSGDAALALMQHTVPAQTRPAQVLRAVTRCVERAVVLQGERGAAESLAPLLLSEMSAG